MDGQWIYYPLTIDPFFLHRFVYFFNRQAKRAKSELDRALQARHVGGWIARKIGGTWGNQEKEGGTLS